MNAENYKTFAIVMVSLGVAMLAAGLMIFFMYPKMMALLVLVVPGWVGNFRRTDTR